MWNKVVRPLLFGLPPEAAHYFSMGMFSVATSIPPVRWTMERCTRIDSDRLRSTVLGMSFSNPVGLAAGFDKDARWFHRLDSLGFGFVEVGSITGEGQPGNPRPRLFRLPKDSALINRMGFNNRGAEIARQNLSRVNARRFRSRCILGINLGKTKTVPLERAVDDYAKSFRALRPFADYFVVNVSSPNTPGLRELQDKKPLLELLESLKRWNEDRPHGTEFNLESKDRPPPTLLKIAPDLSNDQLNDICDIVNLGLVDGIIATNTTVGREGLLTNSKWIEEIGNGGLSGKPLFPRSLAVIKYLRQRLNPEVPLIGVGGVFDADDAWQFIAAGASLIQIYTGFVYGGPAIVRRINEGLMAKLDARGMKSIGEAVGCGE